MVYKFQANNALLVNPFPVSDSLIVSVIKCYLSIFPMSAGTSWKLFWIGLTRRNPSDPSDKYFLWDIGGFIDSSNLFGSYPFGPKDPDYGEQYCAVVVQSSGLDFGYCLCDEYCYKKHHFICEKI